MMEVDSLWVERWRLEEFIFFLYVSKPRFLRLSKRLELPEQLWKC